nr:hypothetical protein [Mucilaginibacter sp. X4EP1]
MLSELRYRVYQVSLAFAMIKNKSSLYLKHIHFSDLYFLYHKLLYFESLKWENHSGTDFITHR